MRKLEEFWFRIFSEKTANIKDWWARYVVWTILATPFIIGVIINLVLGGSKGIGWVLVGCGIMVVFAIIWITVFFYHNWRIKKEKTKLNK
jgi:Na+/melibiose symporter-like transporter